jgi:molybdopterin synthase sulfur carrier subunit
MDPNHENTRKKATKLISVGITIYLSGHLKSFTGGETEVRLDSEFGAVGEVLDSLWLRHPALRDRILTEQGEIRQHVNVFVGSRDVKRLDGLATAVSDDELHIFNAVSGG